MSSKKFGSRLDWNNLLGFSNIAAAREVAEDRASSSLDAKIGVKLGAKPIGVTIGLGEKGGAKTGMKPIDTITLGAKIGVKTGAKPVV